MSGQKNSKDDQVKNLRKNGMSLTEANRWVYGWSDPALKDFWIDLIKSRPMESPKFTQKESFKMILKTIYGKEFESNKNLSLPHAVYLEAIEILVEGILAGHIATRSIKNSKPTREDLFHKARSEFKRLLQNDPEFAHFIHDKGDDT